MYVISQFEAKANEIIVNSKSTGAFLRRYLLSVQNAVIFSRPFFKRNESGAKHCFRGGSVFLPNFILELIGGGNDIFPIPFLDLNRCYLIQVIERGKK
jgi:hypothetical protein